MRSASASHLKGMVGEVLGWFESSKVFDELGRVLRSEERIARRKFEAVGNNIETGRKRVVIGTCGSVVERK